MCNGSNGAIWLFWPSNVNTYDKSLDQNYFMLGWRHNSQTVNTLYVIAGIIPRNQYSFNQVESAVSVLKKKYTASDDLLSKIHVFEDLSTSSSPVTRIIQYDPCLGFEYYSHSTSLWSFKVDIQDSHSFYKSSYDSFMIEISEANRIFREVLFILNDEPENRFPQYNHWEQCNISIPKDIVSCVHFQTLPLPSWEIFNILHRSKSASIIHHDRKINYVTVQDICRCKLERDQDIWVNSMDSILGIVTGIMWVRYSTTIISWMSHIWEYFNSTVLYDNIKWLEQFPVGFKLNVPLTIVFGRLILMLSSVYQSMLSQLWSYAWLDFSLGYISIIFGFRSLLSICHDLARLSTVHISVLNIFFRTIFWFQSSLIRSLWHLFRGKKRNILRQRSDTLQYDFMQLFLGTIMFVICIFLFTTVLVYCIYFCVLDLLIQCAIMVLRLCYIFVSSFPFGYLAASLFQPFSLTIKSEVVEMEGVGGNVHYYKVQRKTLNWLHIVIQGYKKVFGKL